MRVGLQQRAATHRLSIFVEFVSHVEELWVPSKIPEIHFHLFCVYYHFFDAIIDADCGDVTRNKLREH